MTKSYSIYVTSDPMYNFINQHPLGKIIDMILLREFASGSTFQSMIKISDTDIVLVFQTEQFGE